MTVKVTKLVLTPGAYTVLSTHVHITNSFGRKSHQSSHINIAQATGLTFTSGVLHIHPIIRSAWTLHSGG